MGDKIDLRIIFNVGNQFEEVEIDCDISSTVASLYTDVIDHFGNEEKHNIDIKIGEDIIIKEHYDKSLIDLELQPNDKLEFVVGASTDAESSGVVYVLNATTKEWEVDVYPNQDRRTAEAAKEFGLPTVSIPIPVVGNINIGGKFYKKGKVEIDLTEIDKKEGTRTIKPHQIVEVQFTNHNPKDVKPVLLKFYEKDDTAGRQARDELALPHGGGVILTSRQGLIDALIKKNPFTRRVNSWWKPKVPPSHNPKLTYDPHRDVVENEKCPQCGV